MRTALVEWTWFRECQPPPFARTGVCPLCEHAREYLFAFAIGTQEAEHHAQQLPFGIAVLPGGFRPPTYNVRLRIRSGVIGNRQKWGPRRPFFFFSRYFYPFARLRRRGIRSWLHRLSQWLRLPLVQATAFGKSDGETLGERFAGLPRFQIVNKCVKGDQVAAGGAVGEV
ncbi:hypothetical protein ASD07_10645 [Duganella sp. Root336D2]|nr:hypothetical protein ASD07_10645 [Duganella sp. Root336D2]